MNGPPRGISSGVKRPERREWDDWRWQARSVITDLEGLAPWVEVSDEERAGVEGAADSFRMAITPYYASLMSVTDPLCPVRRQAIPHMAELRSEPHDRVDPLGEDDRMPTPGIVHRYPDRALLLVNNMCPVYCRFCTRKRLTGLDNETLSPAALKAAYDWLARTPEVREVILSGGDPLLLSDRRLADIVARLHAVGSVDLVRIHTRLPVVLPQRITEGLVRGLSRKRPLWVVTHFNHPVELTEEARAACERLVDAGIPVENQSVLLRGVNDSASALAELFQTLVRWRVRPYYLHHCDLAEGIGHFRTPLARGPEILDELRGRVSGLALPTFVVDAPGGLGKTPVFEVSAAGQAALMTPLGGAVPYPST